MLDSYPSNLKFDHANAILGNTQAVSTFKLVHQQKVTVEVNVVLTGESRSSHELIAMRYYGNLAI